MKHTKCECDQLANSPVGQVTVCADCKQIHLTLQYLTVRFEPETFRMLAGMVAEAQQCLDSFGQGVSTPPLSIAASKLH